MTAPEKVTTRGARRMRTRQRILGAAIAEFQRMGMADAEVDTITRAAGVAHGTFYFHFPTKGHVLLAVEQREETRIADAFSRYLHGPHDLVGALTEVAGHVMGLQRQLGPKLFKELLALHFSPSRPESDDWSDHRLIVLLVGEIERARGRGAVHPEVDAFYSAMFFLLGIYGALSAVDRPEIGERVVATLVAAAVRGIEAR